MKEISIMKKLAGCLFSIVICLLLGLPGGLGQAKFFVIGGDQQVEFQDLDDPSSSCPEPPPLPNSRSGPEAQLLEAERRLIVCGGAYEDTCVSYDFDSRTWRPDAFMVEPRFDPQSLLLNGKENVVMIGGKSDGDTWIKGSEEYSSPEGRWDPFELELPDVALHHHCLLQINSSLAMLVGGYKEEAGDTENLVADTYFLDLETFEWEQQASMATPKAGIGCGVVVNGDGEKEVVAQYGNDTEIFSLATLDWRPGPPMPADVRYSGTGQLDSTIAVFGGNFGAGTDPYDTVYLFDEVSYEWRLLDNRLRVGKFNLEVVRVPEELLGGC